MWHKLRRQHSRESATVTSYSRILRIIIWYFHYHTCARERGSARSPVFTWRSLQSLTILVIKFECWLSKDVVLSGPDQCCEPHDKASHLINNSYSTFLLLYILFLLLTFYVNCRHESLDQNNGPTCIFWSLFNFEGSGL